MIRQQGRRRLPVCLRLRTFQYPQYRDYRVAPDLPEIIPFGISDLPRRIQLPVLVRHEATHIYKLDNSKKQENEPQVDSGEPLQVPQPDNGPGEGGKSTDDKAEEEGDIDPLGRVAIGIHI